MLLQYMVQSQCQTFRPAQRRLCTYSVISVRCGSLLKCLPEHPASLPAGYVSSSADTNDDYPSRSLQERRSRSPYFQPANKWKAARWRAIGIEKKGYQRPALKPKRWNLYSSGETAQVCLRVPSNGTRYIRCKLQSLGCQATQR